MVVLGCGLNKDRVTPLLASRLDRALSWREESNPSAKFLVSGGQGSDEMVPEAVAMKRYLIEHGAAESDVLLEEKSTTTQENLLFSKHIMENAQPSYECTCVTNNFHVLRAAFLAKSLGIHGQVIGSETAGYYFPAAFIRECAAIIVSYRTMFVLYVLWITLYSVARIFFILP